MEPRIEKHPGKTVVGLELIGEASAPFIMYLWMALAVRMQEIPAKLDRQTLYGIWYKPEGGEEMRYLAGVEMIADVMPPEGMVALTVPPARYAIFTNHGHIGHIGETYQRHEEWRKTSGFADVEGPVLEVYNTCLPISEVYSFDIRFPLPDG